MELILARHGNTFAPGQTAIWVGAAQDLPLVEKGREQAREFGEALLKSGAVFTDMYCASLQRTRQFAEFVHFSAELRVKVIIDKRLDEIDYGDWGGLTNEEIVARFGEYDLRAWNEQGIWPSNCGWKPSEKKVREELSEFIADLSKTYGVRDKVLAVTSNGRLRYFRVLAESSVPKERAFAAGKVKTGNYCRLLLHGGKCEILAWDCDTQEFRLGSL